MSKTVSNPQKYLLPLVIVGVMFFVIGFAVGINGYLVPYLKDAFNLTSAQSYLVLAATFSAFLVFGAPSGWIIKKTGYKHGMSISFLLFALGMYLMVPASDMQSFVFFLLALFIAGMGNTLLQASVNPYVTILGPQDSAATRMSIMGIVNKAAAAFAPIFLSLFLDLNNVVLEDTIVPFYLITGIFIALGVFAYFAPLPEVKAEGEDDEDVQQGESSSYASGKTSIFQFPHLLLGALCLFFYVGVENLALYSVVDYAKQMKLPSPEIFTSITTIFMVIGYLAGVFMIPKVLSQTFALKLCAMLGVVATLAAVLGPAAYSIYFIAILGLANSLMWPAIWPLAIADLGKYTKIGSSVLVMGIVGGAIIPLIFGWLADVSSMQAAYWICFPSYLVILYFAMHGYKIRTKKAAI